MPTAFTRDFKSLTWPRWTRIKAVTFPPVSFAVSTETARVEIQSCIFMEWSTEQFVHFLYCECVYYILCTEVVNAQKYQMSKTQVSRLSLSRERRIRLGYLLVLVSLQFIVLEVYKWLFWYSKCHYDDSCNNCLNQSFLSYTLNRAHGNILF